jgi:hydrogenase nickel incorporation protein HypB
MEIRIVKNVLQANAEIASQIRTRLNEQHVLMLNLMSSPGSGKTTLLENIIPRLQNHGLRVGVIEGDITTTMDANRLQQFEIPITQINTEPFGGDCHLGSEVILPALENFDLSALDVILIENVGNLVCPAEFDTGADFNLVTLSVTEGEDKPLKYPLMFRVCHLAIISKIDLLPYLKYDLQTTRNNIKRINPQLPIVEVSAHQQIGLESLVDWIYRKLKNKSTTLR